MGQRISFLREGRDRGRAPASTRAPRNTRRGVGALRRGSTTRRAPGRRPVAAPGVYHYATGATGAGACPAPRSALALTPGSRGPHSGPSRPRRRPRRPPTRPKRRQSRARRRRPRPGRIRVAPTEPGRVQRVSVRDPSLAGRERRQEAECVVFRVRPRPRLRDPGRPRAAQGRQATGGLAPAPTAMMCSDPAAARGSFGGGSGGVGVWRGHTPASFLCCGSCCVWPAGDGVMFSDPCAGPRRPGGQGHHMTSSTFWVCWGRRSGEALPVLIASVARSTVAQRIVRRSRWPRRSRASEVRTRLCQICRLVACA